MTTTMTEDEVRFGDRQFRALIVRLVKHYKFMHNNQLPKKIIIPYIGEVDGVPIEHEPGPEEGWING